MPVVGWRRIKSKTVKPSAASRYGNGRRAQAHSRGPWAPSPAERISRTCPGRIAASAGVLPARSEPVLVAEGRTATLRHTRPRHELVEGDHGRAPDTQPQQRTRQTRDERTGHGMAGNLSWWNFSGGGQFSELHAS